MLHPVESQFSYIAHTHFSLLHFPLPCSILPGSSYASSRRSSLCKISNKFREIPSTVRPIFDTPPLPRSSRDALDTIESGMTDPRTSEVYAR